MLDILFKKFNLQAQKHRLSRLERAKHYSFHDPSTSPAKTNTTWGAIRAPGEKIRQAPPASFAMTLRELLTGRDLLTAAEKRAQTKCNPFATSPINATSGEKNPGDGLRRRFFRPWLRPRARSQFGLDGILSVGNSLKGFAGSTHRRR